MYSAFLPASTLRSHRKTKQQSKQERRRRLQLEFLEDRRLLAWDFGDAPDTNAGSDIGNYRTLLSDNGPRHAVPTESTKLYFGASVDSDSGQLQDLLALSDDLDNLLTDDEDGLANPTDLVGTIGSEVTITLAVTNQTADTAVAAGWIDFDQDGVFESSELATATVASGTQAGSISLSFPEIPVSPHGTTYARFRISTDSSFISSPTPVGEASDGEVEDYTFEIRMPVEGNVTNFVKLASGISGVPTIPTNNLYHAPANLGDFDGDGIDDLVVTSRGLSGQNQPGSVYLHRMNTDGTVRETTSFSISSPNFGTDVATIGDLNSDGVVDLVVGSNVADGGNGAVFIVFLNSDGSMQSNVKIGTNLNGGPPLTDDNIFGGSVAAIGDVDGDSIPDIAVGAYLRGGTGSTFVIQMNSDGTAKSYTEIRNGEGGLAAGTLSNGDAFGYRVEGLGDLNKDGVPDIAVQSPGDDGRGSVHVLFLNNDGSVNSSTKLASGINGVPVIATGANFGRGIGVLDDLDGNGVRDLAIGSFGDDTGGNDRGAAYIFFMNTDGTVSEHQKLAHGQNGTPPLSDGDHFGDRIASIGDLDGDGVSEIVVMAHGDDTGANNQGAAYVLSLARTQLPGDFGDAPSGYPVSLADDGARHRPIGPRLGADRDSETDGTNSADASADGVDEDGIIAGVIYPGQLGATLIVNVQNAPEGAVLDGWIDFNKDHHWGASTDYIFPSVPVVQGDNILKFDVPADTPSGALVARFRITTDGIGTYLGEADDGEVEDLLLNVSTPVESLGFTAPQNLLGTGFLSIANQNDPLDFDGDGDLDLLGNNGTTSFIAVQNEDGSFTKQDLGFLARAHVDIDLDGDVDFIRVATSQIEILRNDGTNQFAAESVGSGLPNPAQWVTGNHFADMDGDGDLDMAAFYRKPDGTSNQTYFLEQTETGWTPHLFDATFGGNGAFTLCVADIDLDGDIDMTFAVGDGAEGRVGWYRNEGNWQFTRQTLISDFGHPENAMPVDFDGDGDIDILANGASDLSHEIELFANDGSGNFTQVIPQGQVTPHTAGVSNAFPVDLSGDGQFDIAQTCHRLLHLERHLDQFDRHHQCF
jgi:hypothetical protein